MMKSILIKSVIFFICLSVFNIVFKFLFGGWTKSTWFSTIIHKILDFPCYIFNVDYSKSEWYLLLFITPLSYTFIFTLILFIRSETLKK